MKTSSTEFVKEIQQMVRRKHSKDHPIIGLIEEGKLDREQLKGFVGQFYLLAFEGSSDHRFDRGREAGPGTAERICWTILSFFSQALSQTHRGHVEPLSG